MKQAARGFTVIELMTTITVAGVLLAVGIPSFREITRNNRVTSAQNDLVTALTLARSEALRQATPVSVCASANGTSCLSGSGPTDWSTGWIVFVDATTPGTIDAPTDILQRFSVPASDTTLTGSKPFVRYAMTGMLASGSVAQNIKVYSSGCVGAKLRQVDIALVGSLTSTTQNCP
jgi:type IV fimbrial biogenesis protein FimT